MTTVSPRVISSRFITNPDEPTTGVKLKVIDEISLFDPRRRNQEIRFSLKNGPTGKRRVKIVNVGDLSTSTTGDALEVERLLNFTVVDRRSRYWESIYGLLNMEDPLVHYETHKTKIYATDENGVKDESIWIEVQRIDRIYVRDPRNRGQDTIMSLSWKDKTDPEWDYTDVPEPTTDWDKTTDPNSIINPPWRLDPFQNIVDASWGGNCLFVMYGGNKVATFPMSALDAWGTAATGASGASGATGPTGPSYQKTLADSSWGDPWETQGQQYIAAQYKFSKKDEADNDITFSPILWNFKATTITGSSGSSGSSGSTGPTVKLERDQYFYLTKPDMALQFKTKTQYFANPAINIATDGSKVYLTEETFAVGPTGGFGATGPWPGGTTDPGRVAIISTGGTYYYAPYSLMTQIDSASVVRIDGGAIISNGADCSPSEWLNNTFFGHIFSQRSSEVTTGPGGLPDYDNELASSFVGTHNPSSIEENIITASWYVTGTTHSITSSTGGSSLNLSCWLPVVSSTGGVDYIASVTVDMVGAFSAPTGVDFRQSPGQLVTTSMSFLDASIDNTSNSYSGPTKQSLIQYIAFPPSLGATGGKAYLATRTRNDDATYSLMAYTPYASFTMTEYIPDGPLKWPEFNPWVHLSNGKHTIQGFVIDDVRYIYLDGVNISDKIKTALGISSALDIDMMLMDVPTSWVKKLS